MAGKKSLKKAQKKADEQHHITNSRYQQSEAKAETALNTGTAQSTAELRAARQQARGDIQASVPQQTGALQQGAQQATNYLQTNADKAADYYSPLVASANEGFNAYGSALGLGGADAASQYQASPGYQWQLEQGLQALDRQAGARGNPYNGTDVLKFSQGLANQDYQNYVNNLQPYLTVAPGLAGAQANIYGQLGSNLSNIAYGTGQNLANVYGGAGSNLANIASHSGDALANTYTGQGRDLSSLYQNTAQNQAAADLGYSQLDFQNAQAQSNRGLAQQQIAQQQQAIDQQNSANQWNAILGLAGAGAKMGAAAVSPAPVTNFYGV